MKNIYPHLKYCYYTIICSVCEAISTYSHFNKWVYVDKPGNFLKMILYVYNLEFIQNLSTLFTQKFKVCNNIKNMSDKNNFVKFYTYPHPLYILLINYNIKGY